MKKAYPSSSKLVQKVPFSCLSGLICHYSLNGWKNLLFAFVALLLIPSCKKDKTDPAKVASITITPSSPKVAVGGERQLKAAVLPKDAENKEVTWSSEDEDKATVDSDGLVTGVGEGTVAITATATDGSDVKGTVTIRVTAVKTTVKATSVAITPAEPSVGVGESLTLKATALPAEAAQAVTWTSSAPTIARIEASTGIVTGVVPGTATITAAATDGSGITGTATLTVKDNNAFVSAITLGDENFNAVVPANGGTTLIANAPRAILSALAAVKVNIAAVANSAIKIGNTAFAQGQALDFRNPITFTVTAQDGTAKSYTINIPAYNAFANPYGIYTAKHLADAANGLTASYLLKNNIDLPNKGAANAVTDTGISDYAVAGWQPFGYFTGTFDGGNFSINNFYVKRTAEKVGLFGTVGAGGTVKNLEVNGVSGTAAEGNSNGYQHTGILAGSNEGTIDKCRVTGNVSSSSLSSGSFAGGLTGRSGGNITNSYATGNVSGSSPASYSYAGGLAGYKDNSGNISNSYALGNVASSSPSSSSGGLVGGNMGNISNSYAMGNVSASPPTSASYSYAGGLVGYSDSGSIRNSYASGSVSAHFDAGGLVGGSRGGRIANSYATGNVSSSSGYAGGLTGNSGGGSISNSYAVGNVSSLSPSSYVGGLAGFGSDRHTNCYRNRDALIKRNNTDFTPSDASSAPGITAKTKAEMQTDAFKNSLNGTSGNTWGRLDSKNDNLPYINGVGAGK